jgi:hypothetical protein
MRFLILADFDLDDSINKVSVLNGILLLLLNTLAYTQIIRVFDCKLYRVVLR